MSNVKTEILSMLRKAGKIGISGEVIGEALKLTRVSIWRHINKLQDLGYTIRSTPVGYVLDAAPDALYPWELGAFAHNVHHFAELESTMLEARKLARNGAPQMTVVIAESQTKGRGRLSRQWQAGPGGIYATVILRPQLPAIVAYKAIFLVSLCLAKVLNDEFGVKAETKWPNDILVGNQKLVGILSEMEAEDDFVSFVNVGIGINFNNDVSHLDKPATRLADLLPQDVARKDFLQAFLAKLTQEIAKPDWDTLIPRWKTYTQTIGKRVKIVAGNETWEGTAEDIDNNGALLLRLNDGNLKPVLYGDCFFM